MTNTGSEKQAVHAEQDERANAPDFVFTDDKERDTIIDGIVETDDGEASREALADLLIGLIEGSNSETPPTPLALANELDKLLEVSFRNTETYNLALELYRKRFHLYGGTPEQIMRAALDRALTKPTETEPATDAPAAAATPRHQTGSNDHLAYMFNKHLDDIEAMGPVYEILYARERFKSDFSFELLGILIGLLLENEHLPADLREAIESHVKQTWLAGPPFDPIDPENVREFYTLALHRAEEAREGGDTDAK